MDKLIRDIEMHTSGILAIEGGPDLPELEGCPIRLDEYGHIVRPIPQPEWLEKLAEFYRSEYDRLTSEAQDVAIARAEYACEAAEEAAWFAHEDK